MITITEDGIQGVPLDHLGYVKKRGYLGQMVLPVTRWLRAVNAEKYMGPGKSHLDIGCGDGYFLKRSKCTERYGLDKLLGDEVRDTLDFPDEFFDFVTMLAVIEHVPNPEALIREIHRVLKPGSKLILTTPKKSAEWLINLYVKDIDEEHETYFSLESMSKMTEGLFQITHNHTFIFGLNQVFSLTKSS